MELQDEQWQWDDSQAVHSAQESLRDDVDSDLMLATGASTPCEARRLFMERSTLSIPSREEHTTVIQDPRGRWRNTWTNNVGGKD
jgi:hypothetical protein